MFNKKQKNSKGFTLIELLVVIAIIGLLAGIVLVSLGGARNSAKDARIIAVISQTRTLAELVANSNNGSYVGAAPATTSVCLAADNTLNQANATQGTALAAVEAEVVAQKGAGTVTSCRASAAAFCVYAPLNSTGQFYCIDSAAKAIQTSTNPAGATYCDGTTYVCPAS